MYTGGPSPPLFALLCFTLLGATGVKLVACAFSTVHAARPGDLPREPVSTHIHCKTLPGPITPCAEPLFITSPWSCLWRLSAPSLTARLRQSNCMQLPPRCHHMGRLASRFPSNNRGLQGGFSPTHGTQTQPISLLVPPRLHLAWVPCLIHREDTYELHFPF